MVLRKVAGVTLMELLVVMAIIGIIISIAVPGFVAQTQQTRRADAAAVLTNAVARLEGYAIANGYSYEGAVVGESSEHYTMTLTNVSQSTYRINAVPINDQATDPCGTLSIDQSGTRYADAEIDDCWR